MGKENSRLRRERLVLHRGSDYFYDKDISGARVRLKFETKITRKVVVQISLQLLL